MAGDVALRRGPRQEIDRAGSQVEGLRGWRWPDWMFLLEASPSLDKVVVHS
jgi:hypothetical protein